MAIYSVEIPIAGYVVLEVEANSEEQAIEIGLASDVSATDIEQWETFEVLAEGNVLHAPINRASARFECESPDEAAA